jgi:hypothetical protein
MSNNTEQQMKMCSYDKQMTLHYRNAKKRNWILHIVLALITGGFWLIVMFFLAITSGGSGLWTCSQCGTTQK